MWRVEALTQSQSPYPVNLVPIIFQFFILMQEVSHQSWMICGLWLQLIDRPFLICIVESWLSEDISNLEMSIENYHLTETDMVEVFSFTFMPH